MPKPAFTLVCFEAHADDGYVWAVRHRGRWSRWRQVSITAPSVSVYRGPTARQPRAYLQMTGAKLVEWPKNGLVEIVPA